SLIEGLRASDYLSKLAAHPDLVQTLKEQSHEQVAKQLGITSGKLEGWIYPDTYSFTRGTSDLDILTRAYQRMKKVLDQEWQQKQKGLPLNTPYEALILASIVEKETGVAFERPEIAGVFIRRLQKKMRLQTDPTVIYGMGDRYKGNITRADLKRKTAYNTYQIMGLPPTPIANPGKEAIRAVLNPAAGKALYFVAKGDGSHQFSATYAEHNKAVQHYQRSKRRKDYRSAPPSSALSKPKQQQKADS
ncbi:MAG: endolytic transglycosylase MltG, partial [Motiliproteus sp.]|nr:endolytic transglycosylase MltG [Motiliproteus sp.]